MISRRNFLKLASVLPSAVTIPVVAQTVLDPVARTEPDLEQANYEDFERHYYPHGKSYIRLNEFWLEVVDVSVNQSIIVNGLTRHLIHLEHYILDHLWPLYDALLNMDNHVTFETRIFGVALLCKQCKVTGYSLTFHELGPMVAMDMISMESAWS